MREAMRYTGDDEKSLDDQASLPPTVVAALRDHPDYKDRFEAAAPPSEPAPAPEPSTPVTEPGTPAPEAGTPPASPEGAGDTPAAGAGEKAMEEAMTKAFEEMMKNPPPEMIA